MGTPVIIDRYQHSHHNISISPSNQFKQIPLHSKKASKNIPYTHQPVHSHPVPPQTRTSFPQPPSPPLYLSKSYLPKAISTNHNPPYPVPASALRLAHRHSSDSLCNPTSATQPGNLSITRLLNHIPSSPLTSPTSPQPSTSANPPNTLELHKHKQQKQ